MRAPRIGSAGVTTGAGAGWVGLGLYSIQALERLTYEASHLFG
jgi:hypothetical protein